MATNSIANRNSESSEALQFFVAVEEENGNKMFKCKICNSSRNGNKTSNLVAHLRNNHKEIYISFIKRSGHGADLLLQLERLHLLQICVELTTINKQPFTHILHSGFQRLISGQLVKFEKAGIPLDLRSVNLEPLKHHLHRTAEKVRDKIRAELSKKFLSVSVDIVTKNHRCILGIYAQFIVNDKLVVRCIGMEEMHDRHTGLYISKMLENCLAKYSVDSNHIVSITTDNASNMRSFIRNVNDALQNNDESADDLSSLEHLQIDGNATNENGVSVASNTSELDVLMDALLPSEDQWTFSSYESDELTDSIQSDILFVNGVNCAAHTLQLTVKEALSSFVDHGNVIIHCREFCKFTRLQSTICEMNKRGIEKRLPALDVPTRWSSTYIMVKV